MSKCDNKGRVSLPYEIIRLNYDIDQCEENFATLYRKQQYCTPNCCCYCFNKYWAMYHKNYVSISRRKCGTDTITKMGIIPKCKDLKETCVTERAIVDVSVKKSPHSASSSHRKRNIKVKLEVPKKSDAGTDPIVLSSKDIEKDRHRPWGLILNRNKSVYQNSKCRYRRNDLKEPFLSSCESTSSSSSNKRLARSCFMKNSSVQTDEMREKENSLVGSVQIILEQLKKELDGNDSLSSKLDELKGELQKIVNPQTKLPLILEAEGCSDNKHLSPAITFCKTTVPLTNEIDNNFIENAARLKLEETCRELEDACLQLKKERDTSIQLLAEKNTKLTESLKRETDLKKKFEETNVEIKELSIKIENYALSIKNLNEHIKKLQTENKEFRRLEQQMINLNEVLKRVTLENQTLLSELQQVTVERNKLQVALTFKEQQLSKPTRPSQMFSSSSDVLIPEEQEKYDGLSEGSRLRQESTEISKSLLIVPNSNLSTNNLSSVMVPSLYRDNSVDSIKTPSPSSDHLLPIDQEEVERDDNNSDILYVFPDLPTSTLGHHQISFNYLEKLKEEVKNIFTEIKQLANDIRSKPIIEFNLEDISSDFSESNSSNSVVDVRISDLDTN